MTYQTFSSSLANIVLMVGMILLITPTNAQSQNRKAKKKVVRTVPAKNRVLKAVPSRKYAHLPRRGTYVRIISPKARLINFRSISYRFVNGIFYKPYQNQFIVVAPPIGIRVSALPAGYRQITLHKRSYFYYYGTYYVANGKEFEVVKAPLGALVESIPDGYEELAIEGNTYYVVDGTQYKAVIHSGEVWYEVIKVG